MKPRFHGAALAVACAYSCTPAFAGDTGIVEQMGNRGLATIEQIGNAGEVYARISQNLVMSGDENVAYISQTSASATRADILQEGSGDHASITQGGMDQGASIRQTANAGGNFASITQEGAVASGANDAVVAQDGVHDSHANVAQLGSNNSASIFQGGTERSRASINQRGEANTALIGQSSVVDAVIDVLQDGNGNLARVIQGPGPAGADANSMSILQTGAFNVANVTQQGGGLRAVVSQSGVGNTSNIVQRF